MIYCGHKNKGSDSQLKRFLIGKHVLLLKTIGDVQETVWGMFILMLEFKEVTS